MNRANLLSIKTGAMVNQRHTTLRNAHQQLELLKDITFHAPRMP
jgi:hypothetical protein